MLLLKGWLFECIAFDYNILNVKILVTTALFLGSQTLVYRFVTDATLVEAWLLGKGLQQVSLCKSKSVHCACCLNHTLYTALY